MSRTEEYRRQLQKLKNRSPFLKQESNLPGPRGNLELAQAFALEATRGEILELERLQPGDAPENTPDGFLAFCGVLGLGRLIAAGEHALFARLREHASDPRWRVREAVAMALQMIGDSDMHMLLQELKRWVRGNWYERRAMCAGLCEPRLLTKTMAARATLSLLHQVTAAMARAENRSDEGFRTLRQGMGYCWSVAIAASPADGKPLFERWLTTADSDIRWVMRVNLKKNRLIRLDAKWVKACLARLEAGR